MEKNYFHVHILSILVQKVFQEMRDRLVRYVSAHDDVSNVEIQLWRGVRTVGGVTKIDRVIPFTEALIDDVHHLS
jgi:hypothetical protein